MKMLFKKTSLIQKKGLTRVTSRSFLFFLSLPNQGYIQTLTSTQRAMKPLMIDEFYVESIISLQQERGWNIKGFRNFPLNAGLMPPPVNA